MAKRAKDTSRLQGEHASHWAPKLAAALLVPLAALTHRALFAAHATVALTLRLNGDPLAAAVGTIRAPREHSLAELRRLAEPYCGFAPDLLFSADGHEITAAELPLADRSSVVCAHAADIYVHPAVRVGHVATIAVGDRAVELETLSVSPPVFRARGLWDEAELHAVRELAAPGLEASRIGGKKMESNLKMRNSLSTFVGRLHGHEREGLLRSAATDSLQLRGARLARLGLAHAEPVQVVRYAQEGVYWHHTDWMRVQATRSIRSVTVLCYLSDGFEGGETNFPMAGRAAGAPLPTQNTASTCSSGLSVEGKLGDAILFYNINTTHSHAEGAIDRTTTHAGCPITAGEKWVANVWLHNRDAYDSAAVIQKKRPKSN